jgi:hypothetical protein
MYDVYQDFDVSVKECKWLIKVVETKRLRGGKEIRVSADYAIASTDGTNVYWVESAESLKREHPAVKNAGNGKVASGTAPQDIDTIMIALWYVFGSSCYFDSVTDEYIPSLFSFEGKEFFGSDTRAKAVWRRDSMPPRLPAAIAFSDFNRFRSEQGSNAAHLPAVTNAYLEVLETTNCAGLRLPLKATLKQYDVLEDSYGAKTLIYRALTQVKVRSITTRVPVVSFVPQLPPKSFVCDLRFCNAKLPLPLMYFSEEGKWRTMSQLASVHGAKSESVRKRPSPQRRVFRILLVVSFAAPIIMMLVIMQRKQKRN